MSKLRLEETIKRLTNIAKREFPKKDGYTILIKHQPFTGKYGSYGFIVYKTFCGKKIRQTFHVHVSHLKTMHIRDIEANFRTRIYHVKEWFRNK